MNTQDTPLFSESDFDWNNYQFITYGCFAIGCAYRAKYPKRTTDNVKRFGDTWRYLLNRHNGFLMNVVMDFLNNDEWFEIPLSTLRKKMTGYSSYSFYYWRRFLDFAEENGLIKTKKAKTHGILHIQIQFFALKDFILTHINQFWEKIQGWFKDYRSNNKTLTQIDLPDDFSADEVALFEELLKIRNEKHLSHNQTTQQELLNHLLELEKDGCDRKTVMMKAVENKWTRFFHLFKDEPVKFSKPKRRTNGFNSIASFFQRE